MNFHYLCIPSLFQTSDPPPKEEVHCTSLQDNFKLICKAVEPVCTNKENEMSSTLSTTMLTHAIYRCLHFPNILDGQKTSNCGIDLRFPND